ncbi:MAG: glycosyltransferase [Flavobacteriales bacterium]|nr:glycosyltransferase [Flavobacteriales bacterium]
MKFSLITVCFNAGEQLAETLDSVLAQDHPDIQTILVDGAGDDPVTRQVIERYRDRLSVVISEPDKGVYDAMNKGLAMATGEVIGFVNAGDMLADGSVLADLAAVFGRSDDDLVYGDALMVDPNDISRVGRVWKGGAYDRARFRKGWMPPHLGTYFRRTLYERYGGFDLRLRVAADYELLFRYCYKHRAKAQYFPRTIVRFRLGGASNRSMRHVLKANVEVYQAWRMNGERISPFIILRKPLGKLVQVLRARFQR